MSPSYMLCFSSSSNQHTREITRYDGCEATCFEEDIYSYHHSMELLPTEVLNEILLLLHQEDKVECMLVCRHWRQIIERFSLFHTVRVSSTTSLEKITSKLQREPEQRAKVERLIVDMYPDSHVNMNALLTCLPNLRIFLLLDRGIELMISDDIHYPFHKCIECISEFSCQSMSKRLLESNTCPNLTVLSISVSDKSVLSLLKNAPALTKLTIGFGELDIQDLEIMHSSCPSLRALELESVQLEDTDLDHEIKPASLITECTLSKLVITRMEARRDILKYIIKKYPRLLKFVYDTYGYGDTQQEASFCNEQWNHLFNSFGSQLKTLSITGASQPRNLHGILNNANSQISCMTLKLSPPSSIISDLAQSSQMRYIQTLKLKNVESIEFKWLKELFLLKKLKLTFAYTQAKVAIRINDLLEYCPPKLKCLSLRIGEISPDFHDSHPYSIETLSFDRIYLPEKIDTFISRHFPRLSKLKMKRCGLNGRTFSLPAVNLSYLQFSDSFTYSNRKLLVITHCNNERRYFITKREGYFHFPRYPREYSSFDAPIYPVIKSLPESDDAEGVPFFTLECHSLQYAIMGDK